MNDEINYDNSPIILIFLICFTSLLGPLNHNISLFFEYFGVSPNFGVFLEFVPNNLEFGTFLEHFLFQIGLTNGQEIFLLGGES